MQYGYELTIFTGMIFVIAWIEKMDWFHGIPFGFAASAIVYGLHIALFAATLVYYSWDYAMEHVVTYLAISGAHLLFYTYGLPIIPYTIHLVFNYYLPLIPDNSLGLVVLGSDSRIPILHYFNSHPDMTKKLKFVYLGYNDGFLDMMAYHQITENALIIGFLYDKPYSYKIVKATVKFFELYTLIKLEPENIVDIIIHLLLDVSIWLLIAEWALFFGELLEVEHTLWSAGYPITAIAYIPLAIWYFSYYVSHIPTVNFIIS